MHSKSLHISSRIATVMAFSVCLFSCQQKKEEVIVGKWKATAINNPELNRLIEEQQVFIDTLGTHSSGTDAAAAYGYNSVDSLKKAMSADLEQFKAGRKKTLDSTWFEFRKDRVALLNFGEGPDSANWYFDDEGALIFDEQKLKGAGGKLVMQVDSLTSGVLYLSYDENGVKSQVQFLRSK